MAKRKTTKRPARHTSRRRRSVGATDVQSTLTNAAMVLGGVALAGVLNKTVLASKSDMLKALIPMAAGVGLTMMVKSDIGKFAGLGLIAGGGHKLLQKFNIAGIGDHSNLLQIAGDELNLLASPEDLILAGDFSNEYNNMSGDANSEALSMLAGAM